ncbi:MAG: OsmC family protein [Gammaproteobacteria bacterium]|nr:OsmC family protein [Gammaproteobacteria bacterium]
MRAKVSGIAESHCLTLIKVRDLVDVSDEPAERGGTNEGLAPTELFLASLVACSNVITHKIAKKNGIQLDSLEILLDAGFNRLGVTLQEEVDLPFPDIKLRIEISTDASAEQLEILKRDLPRFCPIAKMIEQAGTKIGTEWVVKRP